MIHSLVEESFEISVGCGRTPLRLAFVRPSRDDDWLSFGTVRTVLPDDWDPDYHIRHDGEWTEIITLIHEVVEFEGYKVPAFEGDVERIEWERKRSKS